MKSSACIYLVNPDTGKIVLTTRRRKSEADPIQYGLPGGKTDPGETLLETAIRETFEETGIELIPEEITHVFTEICHKTTPDGEDFKTACFFAEYSGEIPGGQEEGIQALWGDFGVLLTDSPFKDYNRKLFLILTENAKILGVEGFTSTV